jgi:sulfite exporter TauE/SafE
MSVTNMSSNVILSRIVYNLGRIFTYGILGGVVASVGLGFPMIKYQNLLSIILGVALLVVGLGGVSVIKVPFLTNVLGSFSLFLKRLFSKFLQRKNHLSTFVLGSLNGVLPCGLSFLALTYCLTLAGPADGFIFMIGFGVGTLPVMIGLTGIFYWLLNKFQLNVRTITVGMLMLSGVILIARVFILHLSHANSLQEGIVDIVLCR